MSMIKEIELKLQDLVIAETRSPQDESIKNEIAEWKALSRKLAVIQKMSKQITTRITELEGGFDEVIKEVADHKAVVDGAIIEYTQKKGNNTVKYKEAVDYALKMVNEAQKKVLEDFIKSVTKTGEITDVLAITDPEFEQYLLDLKGVTGDELISKIEITSRSSLDRFPKQVLNAKKRELKEGVKDNIQKVIKSLVSRFKTVFSAFFKSSAKAKKANEALVKAVKMDPLKESEVVVEKAPQSMAKPQNRDTEFDNASTWKGACKKVDSQVKFKTTGKEIVAIVGAGSSEQEIGSWDGVAGTVYGDAHLAEGLDASNVKVGDEFYYCGYNSQGKFNTANAKKIKVMKITSDKDHPVEFEGGMSGSWEFLSSSCVPVEK
jgi:hypothetical protein